LATSSTRTLRSRPAAYASAPNYLTTFHYPGLIGQTFKVGVRFTY